MAQFGLLLSPCGSHLIIYLQTTSNGHDLALGSVMYSLDIYLTVSLVWSDPVGVVMSAITINLSLNC